MSSYPTLEELEAKILHSADLIPVVDDADSPGVNVVVDEPDSTSEAVLLEANEPLTAEIPVFLDESGDPLTNTMELADPGTSLAPQAIRSGSLIVVDTSINDYRTLLDELMAGANRPFDIVYLGLNDDVFSKLGDAASQYDQIDAVHFLSHGADNMLSLGNLLLSNDTLDAFEDSLHEMQTWLAPDADLLFYGCNVAAGSDGETMLAKIATWTGADIAASDDATGSAVYQGDWILEFSIGDIQTGTLAQSANLPIWNNVLSSITFQQGVNGYVGNIDTYVDNGSPSTNFGNSDYVMSDDDSGTNAALIRFANMFGAGANQIPAGSTITAVSLQIYVTHTDPADSLNLHTMLVSWDENTTYNDLVSGVNTNDVEASAGSIYNLDAGVGGWVSISNATLVSQLQNWSNGADGSNWGWAFISNQADNWQFYSSEYSGDTSRRPKLAVTFTPPQAPVVTTSGGTVSYSENSSGIAVDSGLTISDSDSSSLTGAVIQITGNYSSTQDMLNFSNQSGITGSWNSGTGTLTLSGTATLAQYQSALRSITYSNSSDAPSTLNRTVSFTTQDAYKTSLPATRTVTVTAVNDAPVLTPTTPTWALTEDATATSFTVASMLGGSISDLDAGALQGIAVYSISGAAANLEYSTNGGSSWTAVGSVSSSSALLLRATDYLRLTPSTSNGGVMSFYYKAWDQSSGGAGTKVSVTTYGGSSAFSVNNDQAVANVSSVNDAPVLDNSGSIAMTTISEDGSSSRTISGVLGSLITDVDSAASEGLAITSLVQGNGHWEYTTDGSTWLSVGAVSASNALLLDSTDSIRYIADGQNGGSASFDFVAWDGSSGSAGNYVDVAIRGGSTAFSVASETVSITTTDINDRPVLNNTIPVSAYSGSEDDVAPVGAVGRLVSSMVDFVDAAGLDNVTEVDIGDGTGIVIKTADQSQGSWWFTTDNGANWTTFGTISSSQALALAADAATRIYFQPNADFNGTVNNALIFFAWDQSDVANGTKLDASSSGPTKSYSNSAKSVSLVISAVNDAPIGSGLATLVATSEDNSNPPGATVSSLFSGNFSDAKDSVSGGSSANSFNGVVITSNTANASEGEWEYSLDSGSSWNSVGNTVSDSSALYLDSTAKLRFVPASNWNGTPGFLVAHVVDSSASYPGGTLIDASSSGGSSAIAANTTALTTTVTAVNDAATLDVNSGLVLNENASATLTNSALSTSDIDHPNTALIYTITLIPGHGSLKLNGVALVNGDSFSQDDIDNNRVSYSHDGSEFFADSFSFSVDDGSGNSTNSVFNLTITPVNDNAPTITSNSGGASANISVAENTTSVTTVTATDLDLPAQTLTYTINGGTDQSRFTIDSVTGVLRFVSAPNFESPTDSGLNNQYDIIVRVSDGTFHDDQALSITVTDSDEFDVSTPTDMDGTSNAVNEGAANGTVVGIMANASDADASTNAVSYSLADDAGGRFTIDNLTGVVTVANGPLLDREAAASHDIIIRAVSADGSSSVQTFTITLNDVDEFDVSTPIDNDASPNTVAETAIAGTTVGITTNSNDADATNNNISYSLTDDAAGRFTIDSVSGIVTVAAGLDYETATSHNITIRSTSADGSFAEQFFTILVSDANEGGVGSVSDTDSANNSLAENASNGAAVGITAAATDPDGTDTVSYSLSDDAGGRFTIDGVSGVVTVLDGSLLDREAGASYNITVVATSSDTSVSSQVFTITLTDVNEFSVGTPLDLDGSNNNVDENASNGTTVGITANANDADATASVSYTLSDDAGGRFAVDSITGVVTVLDGSLLDRETASSHNITVVSTSTDGSTASQTFSISLNDVDEFNVTSPSDIDGSSNSVSENAANGSLVGITASAGDADASNNLVTYQLDDDAGGRFAIDSLTGVVSVADGLLLDREAAASHNIVIRAVSADGSSSLQTFTIALDDVDEFDVSMTVDADSTANEVLENAANGTLVGITANATDIDATSNQVSYSLDDDAGGRFSIDAVTGVISVADGSLLDREAAASYSIIIRAVSADGSSSSDSFTLSLRDADEFDTGNVTDVDGNINEVNENASNGASVGIIANASDADATTNQITYSLDDDAGGRFSIDATTGLVTVADSSLLDRETSASHDIIVCARSEDGSSSTRTFTIIVNDVNEFAVSPIVDNDPSANRVDENALNGTVVGIIANAADGDASNNGVSYHLSDDAGGRFTIDASTGIITVANGSLLDFEVVTSHSITIDALGVDGSISSRSFIIQLDNLNDSAPLIGDIALPVSEQTSSGAVVADLNDASTGTDQDIDGNTLNWSLISGNDAGIFAIDATTGTLRIINASLLDFETTPIYLLEVSASDGIFSDSAVLTITLGNANEAPVNHAPANASTDEDTTLRFDGQHAATLSVSDPDSINGVVEVTLEATHGVISLANTAGLTLVTGISHVDNLVIRGSMSSVNAALSSLSFTPDADYNGNATLRIITDDLGLEGAGNRMTDSDLISITVIPVNDVPNINVPNAPTVLNPGETLNFSTRLSGMLWAEDVERTQVAMTLHLSVNAGTLSIVDPGLQSLVLNGNGSSSISLNGSLDDINHALRSLEYRPAPGTYGLVTMSVNLIDFGGDGIGEEQSVHSELRFDIKQPAVRSGNTPLDADKTESSDESNATELAYRPGDGDENQDDTSRYDTTNKALRLSASSHESTQKRQSLEDLLARLLLREGELSDSHWLAANDTFETLKGLLGEGLNANLSGHSQVLHRFTIPSWLPTAESSTDDEISLTLSEVSAVSLTIGSVIWIVRGSGLLTSLLLSYPAWRSFDPLPVLRPKEKNGDATAEDLAIQENFGFHPEAMQQSKKSSPRWLIREVGEAADDS